MKGKKNMSPPIPPRKTASAATVLDLRRQRLLLAPILPTLLSIAWPTMVQMLMYSAVLLLETWFIGKLGVVDLAGASLVSPANFLMQAMAAGGFGGAVTATMAKAAGSGDKTKVQSLAMHAIVIALAAGFAFSVLMVLCGPWFYRLMGGSGATLDAALAYSNVLFLASPLVWLVVIFAAVLRGVGVVKLQALITVVSSVVLLPLSPALIFGVGPIPALGIRGAAIAVICYYLVVAACYFAYFASSKSTLKLQWKALKLKRADFAELFRIGGISSLLAIQSHITALIITGFAGSFGTVALAGFGAAIRLQQVVDPFIFSVGTATVVMVATCVGAGAVERARRVAVTAALMVAGFCGFIGGVTALFPNLWMELFTHNKEVVAAGALYLRIMGPFYWCVGLGFVLYYCSQGIGRMLWSYTGSALRLSIVAVAGTFSLHVLHGDAATLYKVVVAGMLVSCAVSLIGVAGTDWKRAPLQPKAA